MVLTRRRFGGLFSSALSAAGLAPCWPALARGADDDGPANVFFSPHGRPYRAPAGAPYPVADWFKDANRKGDGKLGLDEFVADAGAFFDVLDLNGDGVLDAREITLYEHAVAPEVLGMRVTVYASGGRPGGTRAFGARLWRAQYSPIGGPEGQIGQAPGPPAMPGLPTQSVPQGDPLGDLQPNSSSSAPAAPDGDANLQGAAPYSLIDEPEPVTAADPDYLFSGVVKRAKFLAHARDNFAFLDANHAGYLTLAGLPQSPVQKVIEQSRRRG